MNRKLDQYLPWILIGLGVLALIAIIAQVVLSLPARTFTFLTGREGGAYYLAAQQYKEYAAQKGFDIQVVPTAGSVEALKLLEEGQGDVAFVQGGIASQGDPEIVSALATVGYEPLWVFYRKELAPEQQLNSPLQLQGRRIGIGEAGSGTNPLARLLLTDYGVDEANTTFEELSSTDALDKLRAGELDAAFMVASTVSPILQEMLADRSLELMNLRDAEALARRHRFLSVLELPRGTLSLTEMEPRGDVKLVSTQANLVVRNEMHPDLIRLLAFAAVDLHGEGGFFAARNEFPSMDNADLPINKEGETYLMRIKNREFTLDRYLPFWASAVFDRYLLFVVPLLLIVLPLISRSPLLYQAYMKQKVNRWYKDVREIELNFESMNLAQVDDAIARLDSLDDDLVRELAVTSEFMPNLYSLRMHIAHVVSRLEKRRATMQSSTGEAAPAVAAADAE